MGSRIARNSCGIAVPLLSERLKSSLHTVFKFGETVYSGPASTFKSTGSWSSYNSLSTSSVSQKTNTNGTIVSSPKQGPFNKCLDLSEQNKFEADLRDLNLQCSQRCFSNGILKGRNTLHKPKTSSGLVSGCKAGPKSKIKSKKEVSVNSNDYLNCNGSSELNGAKETCAKAVNGAQSSSLLDSSLFDRDVDSQARIIGEDSSRVSSPDSVIACSVEDPLSLNGDISCENREENLNEQGVVEKDSDSNLNDSVCVIDELSSSDSGLVSESTLHCSDSSETQETGLAAVLSDSKNDPFDLDDTVDGKEQNFNDSVEILTEKASEVELVGVKKGDYEKTFSKARKECECVAVVGKSVAEEVLVLTPISKSSSLNTVKEEEPDCASDCVLSDQIQSPSATSEIVSQSQLSDSNLDCESSINIDKAFVSVDLSCGSRSSEDKSSCIAEVEVNSDYGTELASSEVIINGGDSLVVNECATEKTFVNPTTSIVDSSSQFENSTESSDASVPISVDDAPQFISDPDIVAGDHIPSDSVTELETHSSELKKSDNLDNTLDLSSIHKVQKEKEANDSLVDTKESEIVTLCNDIPKQSSASDYKELHDSPVTPSYCTRSFTPADDNKLSSDTESGDRELNQDSILAVENSKEPPVPKTQSEIPTKVLRSSSRSRSSTPTENKLSTENSDIGKSIPISDKINSSSAKSKKPTEDLLKSIKPSVEPAKSSKPKIETLKSVKSSKPNVEPVKSSKSTVEPVESCVESLKSSKSSVEPVKSSLSDDLLCKSRRKRRSCNNKVSYFPVHEKYVTEDPESKVSESKKSNSADKLKNSCKSVSNSRLCKISDRRTSTTATTSSSKSSRSSLNSNSNSSKQLVQTTLNNFVIRRSKRTVNLEHSEENKVCNNKSVGPDEPSNSKCHNISLSKNSLSVSTTSVTTVCTNTSTIVTRSAHVVISQVKQPFNRQQLASSEKNLVSKDSVSVESSSSSHREMVRLVPDHTSPFETFCRRRGNRSSRRLCSADTATDLGEKKRLRPVRKTLTTSGSRSDYYSESEESCGGTEEVVRNGNKKYSLERNGELNVNGISRHIVDKMSTRRTPRNGEDAALSLDSSKCSNEDNSSHGNDNHKNNKRCNNKSDSNESNGHKVNGSVDPLTDKLDINMLLEISVADRNKFERKKAMKRKKNADWALISETERFYNEREEILRNKNRVYSSTDEDEDSDDSGTNYRMTRVCKRIKPIIENNSSEDSDSNCSSSRRKKMRNNKLLKENNKFDSQMKVNSEHVDGKFEDSISKIKSASKKEGSSNDSYCNVPCDSELSNNGPRPRGRPRGSRYRKTIYDLTALHEDTDDDNFFSFPVNSGLSNSPAIRKDGRSSRSKVPQEIVAQENCVANNSRKRLSDVERLLRDNKEYYQFPETKERLRASHDRNEDKIKISSPKKIEQEHLSDEELDKGAEVRASGRSKKSSRKISESDLCRITRSKGGVEEADLSTADAKTVDTAAGEANSASDTKEAQKICESSSKKSSNETSDKSEPPCLEDEVEHKVDPNYGCVRDVLQFPCQQVDDLQFSFERIPFAEPWYQTYSRQLHGVRDNELFREEDTLRFILPYEMPKEYFRDHLAKKNLANKKKADFAELVRKSPRCHPSTMALFSDILPGTNNNVSNKKKKGRKHKNAFGKEEDHVASDGTSTPGGDSNGRQPLTEHFETLDDYVAIEHYMQVVLKAALEDRAITSIEDFKDELLHAGKRNEEKDSIYSQPDSKFKPKDDGNDVSETEPPKREVSKKKGKRRRHSSVQNSSNKSAKIDQNADGNKQNSEFNQQNFLKELNLQDDPLALEMDPSFLLEMKQFEKVSTTVHGGTLTLSTDALLTGSSSCRFSESAQPLNFDDFSSIDDFTEASSECMSLVDSENLETPSIRTKKRRKNLTGWPKTKRKRTAASLSVAAPVSDDNDSALGFDDHKMRSHAKIRRSDILPRHVVDALDEEAERRSSTRTRSHDSLSSKTKINK